MLTRPAQETPGVAALWDWMERRRLNQREAAQILGLHFMSLNQILHGHRRPGLAIALRIEAHAGVPAGIWLRTAVRATKRRKTELTASASKHVGNRHVG